MKRIGRFLLILLALCIVIGAIPVAMGYGKYRAALEEKPLSEAVKACMDQENYTSIKEVPEIYLEAVVAVEDRRFYKHHGFDIIGTARAIYSDIRQWKLAEGGSTITQQLAKNWYFPLDNTLTRKIAEIFMAWAMEREYEKEEILEFYINSIYYGSGYYQIYDAAQGYFGKEPSQMTDSECTLLAGIPNAPSVYSLDNNPDLARQRQERVLDSMVDCGYLTKEDKERILRENA